MSRFQFTSFTQSRDFSLPHSHESVRFQFTSFTQVLRFQFTSFTRLRFQFTSFTRVSRFQFTSFTRLCEISIYLIHASLEISVYIVHESLEISVYLVHTTEISVYLIHASLEIPHSRESPDFSLPHSRESRDFSLPHSRDWDFSFRDFSLPRSRDSYFSLYHPRAQSLHNCYVNSIITQALLLLFSFFDFNRWMWVDQLTLLAACQSSNATHPKQRVVWMR